MLSRLGRRSGVETKILAGIRFMMLSRFRFAGLSTPKAEAGHKTLGYASANSSEWCPKKLYTKARRILAAK
jgi:hypothetical protein